MSEICRNEARSVILRLRRYRDRLQGVAAAAAGATTVGDRNAVVLQRHMRTLKSDLDNDAHECDIGRKRNVQTKAENEFLWPALREAAHAMNLRTGAVPLDSQACAELCTAQARIQHYLSELEGRWPTL